MLNFVELPNGLVIANVTPHTITFWREDWSEPVEVAPSGKVVNAKPVEKFVAEVCDGACGMNHGTGQIHTSNECGLAGVAKLVSTEFVAQDDAEEILAYCEKMNVLPVGSIIAAQAYPGRVVAMAPAKGYERVAVPLAKNVQEAINALIFGLDSALSNIDNRYTDSELSAIATLKEAMNAPSKRMSPDKFTVF